MCADRSGPAQPSDFGVDRFTVPDVLDRRAQQYPDRVMMSIAGADVTFAAAGGSGLGVLQAAKDAGKLAIGVDSNQNYLQPGSVLTSMLKRVDNAVYTALKEGVDDATFKPGLKVLGLAEDGVGYAVDDNNKDLITEDMKTKVEDLKAKIIAGEIKVHDYMADSTCPGI